MSRFIPVDRQTDYLLPPSVDEWLPELEQLFVQVLLLAREMKLLKLGTIALDGTKLKANASKHKALSYSHAKKLEAQHKAEVKALTQRVESADQDETADGMDIPAEIARGDQRLTAIAEAKARIEARAQERDAVEQAAYQEKVTRREAQRKAGKKPRGRDPRGPRDKDQVNLTDPESRIMPVTGKGFDQCYNAQAAVDTDTMLVTHVHVTQATNDKQQVMPLLAAWQGYLEALGRPTYLLADTGYFSAANVEACQAHDIETLLAMKRDVHHLPVFERFAADPPALDVADHVEQMARRLKTQAGRAQYALRKHTVEPVFGIIKHVMGFRQVSMRGLDKVSGEWRLTTMAWNIKRMHRLKAG